MKSIQNQYIDLKEGRMSQANFMRNVRMTLPQYVTNITSFKDAVRILKNKAILSENHDNIVKEVSGGRALDVAKKLKDEYQMDEEAIYIYLVDDMGLDNMTAQSVVDQLFGGEDSNEDEEFIDMIARAKEEEEAGKYKFDDFEGGLSEGYDSGRAFDVAKALKNKYNMDEEAIYVYLVDDMGLDNMTAQSVVDQLFGDEGYPDEDYEDPDMFDAYGMDASEGKLREGRKKKEPKAELHPNQIHPQELRMGMKVELEHTDDLDKAKKIALDHLAENPFYYTALKLSGIESPSAPKVKPPVAFKKEVTAAVELVDKVNAMKPVKGFEKAKASSNKAKKETNSGVKGVSELTHNAKSVHGLQKFKPTGGKMKAVREGQLNEGGEWTITGTLTKDEQDKLKDMIGNYELDVQATDDTLETTISHPMYNDKTLEHALKQVRGMLPQKKQVGHTVGFDNVLQSKLEALVREVLAEMYDGRDDMDAQYAQDEISENDGSQEIEKKINTGEIDPAKVKAAAEKAMKGDSTDLALLMAFGIGK